MIYAATLDDVLTSMAVIVAAAVAALLFFWWLSERDRQDRLQRR